MWGECEQATNASLEVLIARIRKKLGTSVIRTLRGEGYAFVADMITAIDRLNPQVAARLVPPLGRWRRFAEDRAAPMRGEIERILRAPGLSKDVYEQASKSLA